MDSDENTTKDNKTETEAQIPASEIDNKVEEPVVGKNSVEVEKLPAPPAAVPIAAPTTPTRGRGGGRGRGGRGGGGVARRGARR